MGALEARVDGHEIHPLPGLGFDVLEEILERGVFDFGDAPRRLIDRHRPHGPVEFIQQKTPEGLRVFPHGKIHDGVGAELISKTGLLFFLPEIGGDGGNADVDIDLGGAAPPHAAHPQGGVSRIGGDGHAPRGEFGGQDPGEISSPPAIRAKPSGVSPRRTHSSSVFMAVFSIPTGWYNSVMEPFLREVDRFLECGKLGQTRSEAVRLAARSCLKGLQIAEDDPDCRIYCVHLGTRGRRCA